MKKDEVQVPLTDPEDFWDNDDGQEYFELDGEKSPLLFSFVRSSCEVLTLWRSLGKMLVESAPEGEDVPLLASLNSLVERTELILDSIQMTPPESDGEPN